MAEYYDREKLYEEVWNQPMTEVCKRYGISDVALAKVCKKLKIPRPPIGYWAKKAAGKDVKKLAIDIHHTIVNKIIQTFRKLAEIPEIPLEFFEYMVSISIDTLFGMRFYLLIILELKSRKIFLPDLTENLCREIVKQ